MKAFEVGVRGRDWTRCVAAETPGKAKYGYLLDVQESWPNVTFTDITCRVIPGLPLTRAQLAQQEADAFNAAHPVGTLLRYWSGLREGEPTGIAPICHRATVMCDHAVIWMAGPSSCHSLTHVEATR